GGLSELLLRDLALAKGRIMIEYLLVVRNRSALADEIVGDGAPQAAIGDPVYRAGDRGFITARQLVFALRARLDDCELMGNRVVDRLIIADFEMQEGNVPGA